GRRVVASAAARRGEPDGCGAGVADSIGIDEHAPTLEAQTRTQELRHPAAGLMGDDVVHGLDGGAEGSRDRGPVIEQLGPAGADRRVVVLKLENAAADRGRVGPSGAECQARFAAETRLTEEG